MRKLIIVLILLTLMAVTGIPLLKNRKDRALQATTSTPPVAVNVITPDRSNLQRTVEVFGSLSPKSSTDIKNELPGRIHHMQVKEWDRVKPGDVLLKMDPADYMLALNRSEAGLKMAKAQLLQSRVDLNRAKREWSRAQKLKEEGLITGQDLDERQTVLESAEARVALSDAQVTQNQALVAEARRNLDKATVYAPIEGTISRRNVDAGDWLDKGTLLFTVVDNRILDFTANVPSTELSQVSEGQLLFFTVDGLPNQHFRGCIKRVNPVVSTADRSGKILAEVENPEGILKGGLFARGQVMVEEHKDAMVLPKTALIGWNLDKGSARVFIVNANHEAVSREVSTGLSDVNVVEIRAGLSGSEQVVVRGGFNLKEGDKVYESFQELEKTQKESPS